MVAVLVAALVLGSAVVGQTRERTTIFVPSQPIFEGAEVPPGGATVSCTAGPPFVLFIGEGPVSGGTCTFEHFGRPGGSLVCDSPTTLFLRFLGQEIPDIPLSAFVCNAPVEEAQPSSAPSSPAPVIQESELDSESGDIDQTFEVS